jgi:hypothetical protein
LFSLSSPGPCPKIGLVFPALPGFVWVRLSPESHSNGLSRPVQGRLRRPLRGFALDSLARPR